MSNINRIHKLLKLLDNFESLSKIKTWLELGEHLNLHHNQAHQFFCPLGIIVIRLNKYDENVYSYLLDALIVGNAIIICCDDKEVNIELIKFSKLINKLSNKNVFFYRV